MTSERAPGLSRTALRRLTAAGVALYALAAGADALMTLAGLGGDPALEGNRFLRGLMISIGVVPALAMAKGATGLALWLFAAKVGGALHDDAAWIERIPTLPLFRRWLRSGDRCWVALVPLYGVAAAQLLAAGAWLWLR